MLFYVKNFLCLSNLQEISLFDVANKFHVIFYVACLGYWYTSRKKTNEKGSNAQDDISWFSLWLSSSGIRVSSPLAGWFAWLTDLFAGWLADWLFE